jgi:hypothetical protein
MTSGARSGLVTFSPIVVIAWFTWVFVSGGTGLNELVAVQAAAPWQWALFPS